MTVCIQKCLCFGGKNVSHATYACMHRVHMYIKLGKPICGGVAQQPPCTKKNVIGCAQYFSFSRNIVRRINGKNTREDHINKFP